jgi:hypothetical protein
MVRVETAALCVAISGTAICAARASMASGGRSLHAASKKRQIGTK